MSDRESKVEKKHHAKRGDLGKPVVQGLDEDDGNE